MRSMIRPALMIAAVAAAAMAAPVSADDAFRTHSKSGAFDVVLEDLKDVIVKRGFVVDYVGQLNAMLERTAADTETVTSSGIKSPFRNAVFVQFCPAKLTHEAVNASTLAVANCPVAIHVFETSAEPGKINVGYRLPAPNPSKLVARSNDKLVAVLGEIAADATK